LSIAPLTQDQIHAAVYPPFDVSSIAVTGASLITASATAAIALAICWGPFCEVLYRLRCNEQGGLGYHLWVIDPTTWLNPDDCDDSNDWLRDFDFDPDSGGDGYAAGFELGSA
jgi:hypothetical protein